MTDNNLIPTGIDIAKDTFDIALRHPITSTTTKAHFENNLTGFRALTAWLKRSQITVDRLVVVMEATGGYELKLARWLFEAKARVHVLNGFKVKKFAESLLSLNKTDAADAGVMAQMAAERTFRPWQPATQTQRQLKALRRRITQLEKALHQEGCRLAGPGVEEQLEKDSLKRMMRQLETERDELLRQLEQLLAQDDKLARQRQLLMSIKCVGPVLSSYFLLMVGQIERFDSARQVAAYLAVTPRIHQSGKTVHKASHLSRWGHKGLKGKMYRPAQTAKRHNPVVRKFVERLRANDPQKSEASLTGAAMRKMVHLMYGVLKSGRPFDPSLHGCT